MNVKFFLDTQRNEFLKNLRTFKINDFLPKLLENCGSSHPQSDIWRWGVVLRECFGWPLARNPHTESLNSRHY